MSVTATPNHAPRRTVTKRDTESGAGQDRVASAALLYSWSEVDYREFDFIPANERAWTLQDRVFYARIGDSGQVLAAWAYRGTVKDRDVLAGKVLIGAVFDGSNKAGRAVELLAKAAAQ
ncbi:hypothetical protein [Mycobacteroides abscessus]|uniref:hypothetical protein n=1 Tax=Mycobacteroides abscessus TaxID=36809 RepID=UPI000C25E04F|nr:hypothetical protein [Mycobacteroides abscessus]